MTKELQTPEILARRHRAFEAYLVTDDQGKRPSSKSIALTLGVTETAVKYWRRVDKWDAKIAAANGSAIAAVDAANASIRSLLRAGALEAVAVLRKILDNPKADTDDKIKAGVALFKLATEFDALEPTAPPAVPTGVAAFADDVPVARQVTADPDYRPEPLPESPPEPATDPPEEPTTDVRGFP